MKVQLMQHYMIKIIILTCFYLQCFTFLLRAESNASSENLSDSAKAAGEQLAHKIVPKLKREGVSVIFLNIGDCFFEVSWCSTFSGEIERQMIAKGLRYLPEDQRTVIRDKIAGEQVYQNASGQVDVNKIVQLGQQRAVQAFVSIGIKGDLNSEIRLTGSSINIKEGLVTINEGVTVKVAKETTSRRTLGTWANAFLLVGSGTVVASYGYFKSNSEKQSANEYYSKYNDSKTAEEAKQNKVATKKHDDTSSTYQAVACLGLFATAYGVHYFATNKEFDTTYHYNISFAPAKDGKIFATTFGWNLNL